MQAIVCNYKSYSSPINTTREWDFPSFVLSSWMANGAILLNTMYYSEIFSLNCNNILNGFIF